MKIKHMSFFKLICFFCICGLANAQALDWDKLKEVSADQVVNSYAFSWKCVVALGGESRFPMEMVRYYEPGVSYIGTVFEGFFILEDEKKNLMLLRNQEDSTAVTVEFVKDEDQKASGPKKLAFKQLQDKTIAGYKCKGAEAVHNGSKIQIYYTDQVPTVFPGIMTVDIQFETAVLDYLQAIGNPMVMSCEMIHIETGMNLKFFTCTSFEKINFTFNKADCRFIPLKEF